MNRIIITILLGGGILFSMASCLAYQVSTHVPMDEEHWTLVSDEHKFEEYLGKPSLYLPKGYAQLNEVDFHNGIIEMDIAFPEGRGFPGITFRIQDDKNYEEFYLRPHQSGNPDANQYTPVFNGLSGWQLYHGEGHAGAISYRYDAWNHVKLVIKGTVGEVYINDMENPLFQIHELKHGDSRGSIAFRGDANAHFANFSYTSLENPTLKLEPKAIPELDKNVVSRYQVSSVLADSLIAARKWIKTADLEDLTWTDMGVEYTGTLNIAKAVERKKGHNTSLIKVNILSEKDQIKQLEFGYSDAAHVFVNGQIQYAGQRQFRSRDYRYLGTIGYFDAIYLDLKKGENEVIFAITEAFGGWGLRAKFEDKEGIQVK